MSQILSDISHLLNESNRQFFSGKSILITGASGLLGNYFTVFLQELSIQCDKEIHLSLSTMTGNFMVEVSPKTKILRGDISDHRVLQSLPEYDVIIHAAGYGQPKKFLEDTKTTIGLNTSVTLELIQKVRQGGKFLFLSTSEIYSGLDTPPFGEEQVGTTNTNHERAPYIESKRTGEAIVSSMKKRNGKIQASSVRLALAYGPGTKQGDSRVLNSFIEQAVNNKKIIMGDTGSAWRTYCYVLDAIELCLSIIKTGTDDIYNVGGISRLQISDLAQKICEITGATLIVPSVSDQFLKGAPDDVWLNLEKVLELSNKVDFVDIMEGLQRTINWNTQHKSLL
jgi:nucleoside-diphosphate-sugar epimerase